MATPAPSTSSFSEEKTFRSFSKEQGKNYAEHRRDYHPKLYQIIIDHHTSTGGQLDTIVDVGCGPGQAIRALAPRFTHAFGIDPSEGMISTARSLGGATSTAEPIRFEVSTAEDLSSLSPPIPDGSIDLITAATAAHWFDLPRFWPQAARILKPGGSVALWSGGPMVVDSSMPNHAAIQAAIDSHKDLLKDYMLLGNRLPNDLYVELPLPWTIATPVPEFDKATFLRKEWNTDDGSEPGDEFFAQPQIPLDLDTLEKVLGTASPVIRWREAHPEAVGTDHDVVREIRLKIERILHEAGVEKGKEILKGGVSGVLLVVKKKA